MPLFMDRHYVEGVAFEDVRLAHEKDKELELEFGITFVTYWFDEGRHTTFCLIEAPNPELIAEVHERAHGGVPNDVVPVDQEAVLSFMGRIADIPADQSPDGRPVNRAFRAIMFTDIVDFTSTTSRSGDENALQLVRAHNTLVRDSLMRFGGNEVKQTGDGLMASFADVDQALRSAVDIQRGSVAAEVALSIGVSAGEPIEENGDFFGSTVNLASRLCDAAGPGDVYLSAAFVDAISDPGFEIEPLGDMNLKGFAQPERVCRVAV